MSSINDFEIKIGLNSKQKWAEHHIITQNIEILPIDEQCINEAVKIYHYLKRQNQLIELADLLIGATAMSNFLPLATLNKKHFKNIPALRLISTI